MRRCLIVFLTGLLPVFSIAQSDYILIDSTLQVGVTLIDQGSKENSKSCILLKKNGDTIRYSPYQVLEYGLRFGRKYKSMPAPGISSTRLFYEVISHGSINIYYLPLHGSRDKFFYKLQDESPLTALPQSKKEIKNLIKPYITNCPVALKNLSYIKRSRSSLIRYFEESNSCSGKPLPRFKYGIYSQLTRVNLSANLIGTKFAVQQAVTGMGYLAGLFSDFPLASGNFSFHPDISLARIDMSKTYDYNNFQNEFIVNNTSLNLMLFFRYSEYNKLFSPYFQLGPVFSKNNQNETTLYEYEHSNNAVNLFIIDTKKLNKNMGGFSAGTGMIFNYSSDYAFSADFRFTKLFNLEQSTQMKNFSLFSAGLGLILQ